MQPGGKGHFISHRDFQSLLWIYIKKKKKKDITEIMERNGMGNRKLEILWMWGREGWNLRISFLVNLLINFCKYVVSLIVLENISRF